MRRALFWLGWAILFILPVVFAIQVYMAQDLPKIEAWKWAVPGVAIVLIYFCRSRDEVIHHHIGA